MMDVKRFLFHSGRSRFTAMLEVTCTVVSNWEIVILCPSLRKKIEDNTLLVTLLINYQLKLLVCFVLSRFCNLKFTSKYNSLNRQNLSSLKEKRHISFNKSALLEFNT